MTWSDDGSMGKKFSYTLRRISVRFASDQRRICVGSTSDLRRICAESASKQASDLRRIWRGILTLALVKTTSLIPRQSNIVAFIREFDSHPERRGRV